MKISEILTPDRVYLDISFSDRNGLIKELVERLSESEEVKDVQLLLKDVLTREELDTTAIGDGIAIPHARTDAVSSFIIGMAVSKTPIDFCSKDGCGVNMVFLMGTPKVSGLNRYLRMLANLTRLLQHRSVRESLLAANSSEEIIEIFKKAEEGTAGESKI